jgi:murein DD-endopeptidase MepM/ murein hydrolase activator NlpD
VNVSLGSSVAAGQILGSSGQTPEGEGIHFQLWQNRQRLDPLKWIR